jgi:voltage-gated potassium channel
MNEDPPPPHPQGFLAWLARRSGDRPLTARRALAIIMVATLAITVAGGVAIRLLDHKDFDSIGEGMWWAVQTVTTVGYGDVVPSGTGGRLIGTVVMLTGIAFISLITASVTALLVEQARQRRQGERDPVAESLAEINTRLAAIEGRLAGRGRDGDPGGG